MPSIRDDQYQRLREQFSVVERFAAFLTQHDDIDDVLRMLTDQVAAAVGATGAGVTLAQRNGYVCVAAPNPAISDLERVVETTQTGPSIEAAINERPVTITNLNAREFEQRWPSFVARAKANSIRAVAALPMISHGRTLGALEMYDKATRLWTAEDTRAARIMADMASMYMDCATERNHERNIVDQLHHALTSRIDIEQAKGLLAARYGITTDAAFAILRQTARDNNLRLHDVCREMLDPYQKPAAGP
jgi:GAF domain-containing protein